MIGEPIWNIVMQVAMTDKQDDGHDERDDRKEHR